MLKRNRKLINEKITQYLLPGILMAMALQLGNVVDAVFVGNYLGTDAMAALNLALPIDALIQIPGYVLGVGGSIAAGIMLGKRDRESASRLFSSTFYITLFAGIIFAVVGAFAAYPLGSLLAAGGELSKMTGDYLIGNMLGAPIIGLGLLMVSYLGAENHPGLASAYLIVSNAINLIVDYFLLKYTNIGTLGASLSTVIGFLLGMVVMIWYIRSPKRMIKLIRPQAFKTAFEALKTGVPVLIFMVMTIVKTLAMNIIVLNSLGERGIEVMTICEQVLMIVEMLTGGIIGIIPNLAGVLYGERDFYGIRTLCTRVLKYSAAAAVLVMAVVVAFPSFMAGLFGVQDALLLDITSRALRILMIGVPFYVWNKFLISYYESIEQSTQASIITLAQSGIFAIPVAMVGIGLALSSGGDGYNAIAWSGALAEIFTVALAFAYRRLRYKKSSYYMLPEKESEVCLDFTVHSDIEAASAVPREIIAFCRENGVDSSSANLAAVAVEEMCVNSIQYGGKSSHWIDVCLNLEADSMQIRIRDNGKPFNPLEYVHDEEDFASVHGINIIKSISTGMNYIRAMDMNNTVIEFKIKSLAQEGEKTE